MEKLVLYLHKFNVLVLAKLVSEVIRKQMGTSQQLLRLVLRVVVGTFTVSDLVDALEVQRRCLLL